MSCSAQPRRLTLELTQHGENHWRLAWHIDARVTPRPGYVTQEWTAMDLPAHAARAEFLVALGTWQHRLAEWERIHRVLPLPQT